MKKMTIDEKLEEYRVMKEDLAQLKQDEMDLRVEIADEIGKGLDAGTHNFSKYAGLKVKLVSKLAYSIDKNILEGIVLSEEEAECIRWKPELNLTKFKQVDTDALDDAITIKPGAPTITVELV